MAEENKDKEFKGKNKLGIGGHEAIPISLEDSGKTPTEGNR